MKKGTIILLSVVGLLLILLISIFVWFKNAYNNFVTLEEGVKASWSQVDNQYQRRMDLIPNLVNTVKGVANFEKETFTAVAEARSKAGQVTMTPELLNNPQAFQRFQQAQDGLGSALSRLLITVEKYPELKANENFLNLQSQLEGTENRISVERKKFNEVVQQFNTAIRRFPSNIVANMSGFSEKQYFKAAQGANVAPKVQF